MSILINLAGSAATRLGSKSILLNVSSVSELKATLKTSYPEIGKLSYQVFVNNKLTDNGSITTTDKVTIFPPYVGG